MREKHYHIPISPVAWKRAALNTKYCRIYDTQKHEKLAFGLYLKQQHKDEPQFKLPTFLDITFYFPLTKRARKENLVYYDSIPDADNCIKMILDILKDCEILSDDRIIVGINSWKLYGDPGRTEFTLKELGHKRILKELV